MSPLWVPYPYAIDTDGDFILMLDKVKLKGHLVADRDDPYNHYYAHYPLIESCTTKTVEYYTGNDRYTLRYSPYPEKNYVRLSAEGSIHRDDA